MKITIHNLGVVREAEIDLKPLTIFVGPNNTGKTWTAYTLLGVLGRYGWEKYLDVYISGRSSELYVSLERAVLQLLKEGNARVELDQFAEKYGEGYFNNVALSGQSWLHSFFSTDRASFEDLKLELHFSERQQRFLEQVRNSSFDRPLAVGSNGSTPLVRALKESGDSTLYFYTEGDISEKLPFRVVREFLVGSVFQVLITALYSNRFTFPTERTAYTYVSFLVSMFDDPNVLSLINAPNVQSVFGTRSQTTRPIPSPLIDFLAMLVLTGRIPLSTREELVQTVPEISNYLKLSQLLESAVLQGQVAFSEPGPTNNRELLFTYNNFTLELSAASSMAKELAPLILCLRYLVEPNALLIIDEPEMNLHSEAQARLMEFLAMLVNAGLNVLFTTHSPYMVDHLVNLMKAAKHEDKDSIKDKFYLQRTEAFIPQDQVSVYLFGDGTAKSILCEDGSIDWGTFADVSDRINQIYFELS